MSITKAVWAGISLQALVLTAPLVSSLFQFRSPFPFPPMGDESQTLRFFAMVFAGTAALIPYFVPKRAQRKFVVLLLFGILIVSGLYYIRLENRYIVALSDGATFVVKGTIRNQRLQEPYASMSDQNLIEHSGVRDADLSHAYVWDSVEENRAKVFRSYVFTLIALQIFFGYAAITGKARTRWY